MTKERGDAKRNLNKTDLRINRGFELMLKEHSRREKPSEPKLFRVRFGKMLSLFRREIHFNFELSLDVKKK